MKKLVLAITFLTVLTTGRTFADTQAFTAYGSSMLSVRGTNSIVGTSVAFHDFTLYTTGYALQLDSPGYFGATNYEMLGDQGDLTIAFTVPQNSFTISLRNFTGYPGGFDQITVFGADDTTVLSTYSVWLDSSIFTSTDNGESAPIGAVNLAKISGQEPWTGALQSVTFSNPDPAPEPGSLSLLAVGVLGLVGIARRKLIQ